jgi:uncharacterized lipoprotein YddW (UPF0748 family)
MTPSFSRRQRAFLLTAAALCVVGLGQASAAADRSDSDAPSFRAFWVNAFDIGFKSRAQVDEMVSLTVAGNYNVIVAEVLAYQDDVGNGHGAYWHSQIVPWAAEVDAGFDPLAYLVETAHAADIEVHCWLVPFRVCNVWPPAGNDLVASHPEWLTVKQADMGTGPRPVLSEYYILDPGSPDVQNYLLDIVQELCRNYAIDGIHWDYIRYIDRAAGYPTDLAYEGSSLRRYQRLMDTTEVPSSIEPTWDDFRRRTITEIVRRTRFEMPRIDENPRQPLRHTAALITSNPPSPDFEETRPYRDMFCNWEYWIRMGYLDATIPMAYFRETSDPTTYRRWVDNAVGWAYDRHTYIGVGVFVNYFDDSVTQIEYALGQGAHGVCTYSYPATGYSDGPWYDWYPYVASSVFAEPVPVPGMPWRDPATAVEGTVWGQVTDYATGLPVDNASVRVGGMDDVLTDANGYYVVTLIPATATGTPYDVTAVAEGYELRRATDFPVVAGDIRERHFVLGGPALPGDMDADLDIDFEDLDPFTFCLVGPEVTFPPTHFCTAGDADGDRDLDLVDVASLQREFTGPGP